jgi:membrane protein
VGDAASIPAEPAEPGQLTPEDRAHPRGRVSTVLSREFARLHPGAATVEVVKRAVTGVWDNGFIYAGNLAYLALMTLFPFAIVTAAVLSILGQSAETHRAIDGFLHVLPPGVAELLRQPIADVLRARTGPLLWLGGLVGLWTVGSFVETIREIFRRAYGTRSKTPLWRSRLATSTAIVASVVVALLAFVVQGLLTAAEQFVTRLLPFAGDLAGWIGLSRLIPGAVMFGALYILFYSVTPAKYRYSSARKWPGALFTTAWWVSCTALLPFVLAQLGGYDRTYGALSGVVVMLLFFYLIGLGFCFGAHLNAALAEPPEVALQGGSGDMVQGL